ncbi:MAG: DNA-deoxyinosine glycosylase [Staphylococcus sp.]|jgi:hypothetical protein|nr:DNA-deoxyinosine glycosylase [Staphylococcus sp.]
MNKQYTSQIHNIEPIWDCNSRILILGSFPSVKSREMAFFYGHPQNRFWKVIANIYEEELPKTIDEKKEMLLKHKIAIWDVIKSCDIIGSADNSIKNVVPNNLDIIFKNANIENIYVNGNQALNLYNKYLLPIIKIKATLLPSTSPANATYSFEKLCTIWQAKIKNNQ